MIDEKLYVGDEFETDIVDGYYIEEIEKPAVESRKQRTESDGELGRYLKIFKSEDVDLSLI